MNTTVILILLLCPETPDLPKEMDQGSWASLKVVAGLLELWPTDGRWLDHFGNEFQWTHRSWRQCYGLPPASDIYRFPSYEHAAGCAAMADAYASHLENRTNYPSEWRWEAMQQTRKKSEIWWAAASAANPNNSPSGTRLGLSYLRDLIGEDEYHLGRLPFHLPLQHFQEVK